MPRPILLPLLVALLFLANSIYDSHSQETQFETFEISDKLSNAEVYHMIQDRFGHIWYASDRGISVYNGYELKFFDTKNGIPDQTIFRFYPQQNGLIWCASASNTFYIVDPEVQSIQPYQFNHISSQFKNVVNDDLYIDENQTLHVAFLKKKGLMSINQNGKILNTPFHNESVDSAYLFLGLTPEHKSMSFLHTDSTFKQSLLQAPIKHKLYSPIDYHKSRFINDIGLISDMNNLYLYRQNKCIKTIPLDKKIISLGRFDAGHFWVGLHFGGVLIFDLSGELVDHFLKDKSVTHVMTDHEKNLWIATIYSGVLLRKQLKLTTYPTCSSEVINRLSLLNNQLVINTSFGNTYLYDTSYTIKQIDKGKRLHSLTQYYHTKDTIQFSRGGLTNFSKQTTYSTGYIINLSDDSFNPPIAIKRGEIQLILSDQSTQSYYLPFHITDAIYNSDSSIYIASHEGLFNLNLHKGTYTKINAGIHFGYIYDIDRLRHNSYVLATRDNGIILYNDHLNVAYAVKKSLSDISIYKTFIENDSTIWTCTSFGLDRLTIHHNYSINIHSSNTANGTLKQEITDLMVLRDTVWLGTKRGLLSFPLAEFNKQTPPKNNFLKITQVHVNDQLIANYDHLSYFQNHLKLTFEAISFKAGSPIIYKYKLDGIDKNWRHTTNLSVTYESLPPGRYTFSVQAIQNDKWHSTPKTLTFTIYPPFYSSWWFRLLTTLLIITIIYLFFKLKVLAYNKEVMSALLRTLLKKISPKSAIFIIRENGMDVKINSQEVLFVKSAGNYIEIYTSKGRHVTREKISNFRQLVPDPTEYIQVRRSCIVRIDKIEKRNTTTISINNENIPIGNTYIKSLSKLEL